MSAHLIIVARVALSALVARGRVDVVVAVDDAAVGLGRGGCGFAPAWVLRLLGCRVVTVRAVRRWWVNPLAVGRGDLGGCGRLIGGGLVLIASPAVIGLRWGARIG